MAGNETVHDQMAERAERLRNRPIHVFTLPHNLQELTGVKTLGFVELNADEELDATRRARNDQIRLAWELAKGSLREMNGKPLRSHDGSVDSAWSNMHPKARSLALQAYTQLHQPKGQEAVDFLASVEVGVG